MSSDNKYIRGPLSRGWRIISSRGASFSSEPAWVLARWAWPPFRRRVVWRTRLPAPVEQTATLLPRQPHFPAKAKHVVHIFAQGAPSHVDTWDPKPALAQYDGKSIPGHDGCRDGIAVQVYEDGANPASKSAKYFRSSATWWMTWRSFVRCTRTFRRTKSRRSS